MSDAPSSPEIDTPSSDAVGPRSSDQIDPPPRDPAQAWPWIRVIADWPQSRLHGSSPVVTGVIETVIPPDEIPGAPPLLEIRGPHGALVRMPIPATYTHEFLRVGDHVVIPRARIEIIPSEELLTRSVSKSYKETHDFWFLARPRLMALSMMPGDVEEWKLFRSRRGRYLRAARVREIHFNGVPRLTLLETRSRFGPELVPIPPCDHDDLIRPGDWLIADRQRDAVTLWRENPFTRYYSEQSGAPPDDWTHPTARPGGGARDDDHDLPLRVEPLDPPPKAPSHALARPSLLRNQANPDGWLLDNLLDTLYLEIEGEIVHLRARMATERVPNAQGRIERRKARATMGAIERHVEILGLLARASRTLARDVDATGSHEPEPGPSSSPEPHGAPDV